MSEVPVLSLHEPDLPLTRGSLLRFSDDPIACMKELHRDHGDLAVWLMVIRDWSLSSHPN